MTLVLYFLHGKSTRGCYKPLPLGGTPSSMFNDAYIQLNMLAMELYFFSKEKSELFIKKIKSYIAYVVSISVATI